MAVKLGYLLLATGCGLLLLEPGTLVGQAVSSGPLEAANGSVKAPFTNVRSMHELSDGRVILTDGMAGIFGVGNFTTGKFERIPNVSATAMIPLAGDSSMTFNLRGQWIFLDGPKPIGMLDQTNPVVQYVQAPFGGADALGYMLATKDGPVRGDSTILLRVSRVSGDKDTVTKMYMDMRPPPSGANGQARIYVVYEQAALAMDGWIAILRTGPYRVDWRKPDGTWVRGAPLPVPVVKLDDREKRAFMAQRAARRGGTPEKPETLSGWPDEVPPWTVNWPPILSSDGKLIVHRTPTADFPDLRYDVINRRGELERQITLAANETILGFGTKSVYVTVTGKDGMQSVERHPWP